MTNNSKVWTDALPEVKIDPRPEPKRDLPFRIGQAIAVVAGLAVAALFGSLLVWGITAIWRAILG